MLACPIVKDKERYANCFHLRKIYWFSKNESVKWWARLREKQNVFTSDDCEHSASRETRNKVRKISVLFVWRVSERSDFLLTTYARYWYLPWESLDRENCDPSCESSNKRPAVGSWCDGIESGTFLMSHLDHSPSPSIHKHEHPKDIQV